MRTGSRFPLGAFEARALRDAAIVGVVHAGSVGRGRGDEFSDLDFEVVLADPRTADAKGVLLDLCAGLGPIQFSYWRNTMLTAFVGEHWQRADLRYVYRSEMLPAPQYAGARVIKDLDGSIAAAVARSTPPTAELSLLDPSAELSCAIDSQIYVTLHNARGATWSAMGELVHRLGRLYALLAAARAIQVFGLREMEQVLQTEEEKLRFEESWPSAPHPAEVRRAALSLWQFTLAVRDVLASHPDLGVLPSVDEAALQRAVDAIYLW
jgi:predicted nucleotidyltransferase